MNASTIDKTTFLIRNATLSDAEQINQLLDRTYPHFLPGDIGVINGQIKHFSQGQFVVALDTKIIGYCATICVSGNLALAPHTWDEITGKGYCSTHNPNGDFLYGVEACIDSEYRGRHLGRAIYNKRKALCIELQLKGIIFGGRLIHYAEEESTVKTPEQYLNKVQNGTLVDETILFQLHNGFEPLGVLRDYLPEDDCSLGYAAHLIWHNPQFLLRGDDIV